MSAGLLEARCSVDPEARRRFSAGTAEPRERGAVLRHLFAGCAACLDAVREQTGEVERAAAAPIVGRVMANVAEFERRLAEERGEAAELWREFRRHPPQRQWTILRNSSRYLRFSLAEVLLDEAFEAIYDDARRSLDLAEMGLFVAQAIRTSIHSERTLHDLRSRAWGRVANARRATSDLLGAEQAIASAAEEFAEGTGDPLLEAEHEYFTASIHRAQRRFEPARQAVRRSGRIYRALGDRHLEGRSLLNEALIQELDGDLPGAIARIQRAIPMVDESRDRHLALGARHNLLWCLTGAGRAEEAARELEELRPRYAAVGDAFSLILLRWMEGRIAVQLGRPERAEAAFRESYEQLVDQELSYEAALVALDMAALFVQQGRTAEVKSIASNLVAVYHRLGVAREAIAALMLFEQAAQAEAVTSALLGKLASYIERAKRSPGAIFSFDGS